jgi:uncharacterized protein (UPF0335 family)
MGDSVSINNNRLADIIDRIEALESDKAEIASDIKEVYAEAKSGGFDPKIIRKVIALRRMDRDKRAEEQALIDTYMAALGQLADTPLGQAAVKREFK